MTKEQEDPSRMDTPKVISADSRTASENKLPSTLFGLPVQVREDVPRNVLGLFAPDNTLVGAVVTATDAKEH